MYVNSLISVGPGSLASASKRSHVDEGDAALPPAGGATEPAASTVPASGGQTFDQLSRSSMELRDRHLQGLVASGREAGSLEPKVSSAEERPLSQLVVGNTVVVRPGSNEELVFTPRDPTFEGLTTSTPDGQTGAEVVTTLVEGSLGGAVLTEGMKSRNLLLMAAGATMVLFTGVRAGYDVHQSHPDSYEPGDTIETDDGIVWSKLEDGRWTTLNEETGIRTTNDYGDDPNDYIQTIERPYLANEAMCTEVVTAEFVDNELTGSPQTQYLDEQGGNCSVRPDGTLNPAVGFTPSQFSPGESFIDGRGDEWTKQQDGTFTSFDRDARVTRTVDYGDNDDTDTYTYTTERDYDTDEGECTEVIEGEVEGGDTVSTSVEYLDSDGGACAVKPDGSLNPAAASQQTGGGRGGDNDDPNYEGWDGNDSGNGAGSDGDPEAGHVSTF